MSVKNVCELPRHFADTQPQTAALVDKKSGRTLTFAQLRHELDLTARGLSAAGFKPKDRAALFVASGIEFAVLVNACFQAGIVPVLIDPGMGVGNVLNCIREQRPVGLIGVLKAHVLRSVARKAFASVKTSVRVGRGYWPNTVALSHLVQKAAADATPMHQPSAGDVAAVLYTSGSTGAPKGVLYTHEMLAAQSQAIADMFHIQPGEIDVACFLPFGLFSIAMGMTAVFPEMDFRFPARANPQKILDALENATSAFASPALWEPFAEYLATRPQLTLPRLKRVLTAGAPVRARLSEQLLPHLPQGDVYTPYGATEALPIAFMSGRAVVTETAELTRAGRGTCVGSLAPHIAVKIIAISDAPIARIEEARLLAPGEVGEIIVRGPNVTRAYDEVHSPKGARANLLSKIADDTVPEGFWHRMGDCGYFDALGRLWFCGRKNHRVETPHGTFHSVPVEAVAEELMQRKAAFVGVGTLGQQKGVIIYELTDLRLRLSPDWELRNIATLNERLGYPAAQAALLYRGSLPVDRRHNAKIERETLARWAAQQRPSLGQPSERP